jgi:hypothetical protein
MDPSFGTLGGVESSKTEVEMRDLDRMKQAEQVPRDEQVEV